MSTTETSTTPPFTDRGEFDTAVAQARAAGAAYYDGTTAPILTDGDYDQLIARIAATEQQHPNWNSEGVTTTVAAGASDGKVTHSTPMLSLGNVFTPQALESFVATLTTHAAAIEVKVDGMAVCVVYRDGHLHQAAKRGNGTTGDDITHQVTRDPGIAGLPAALPHPWSGEIRGEIYMSTADFEAANAARTKSGKPPFVNPRNATSGSINKIERDYVAPMSFAAYAISGDDLHEADSHLERMAFAKSLGVTTTAMLTIGTVPAGTSILCRNPAEIQDVVDAIGDRRVHLPFPIDGAVVKADSREVRRRMGSGSSTPHWATAYKFAPDTAYSVLRGIEVSVGRTGQAGFRAIIDPVAVGGTTISYATLHNVTWIEQQGLGVGSTVSVMRAGDVIPKITAVVGERPDGVVAWEPPPHCPQCGEPWDTSGVLWRCVTATCSLVSHLTYAASRDVWDITGLGDAIAEALVESGLVRDIADLFDLTVEQVAAVPYPAAGAPVRCIGTATAEKLVAGIAAAVTQPLARHITALGIPKTGRSVGRWLASTFRSLDALRAAGVADLTDIEGLGPEKATAIHSGLRERAAVLDRLVAAGITTRVEDVPAPVGMTKPLAGKRVAITGSIPDMNRTEGQEAAELLGATLSSSVSAKTDLLIVGAGTSAGSKLAKAQGVGVPTMTADEFVAMHTAFLANR